MAMNIRGPTCVVDVAAVVEVTTVAFQRAAVRMTEQQCIASDLISSALASLRQSKTPGCGKNGSW
jgi:hypothetical protein